MYVKKSLYFLASFLFSSPLPTYSFFSLVKISTVLRILFHNLVDGGCQLFFRLYNKGPGSINNFFLQDISNVYPFVRFFLSLKEN
jgi:hypothetical protein